MKKSKEEIFSLIKRTGKMYTNKRKSKYIKIDCQRTKVRYVYKIKNKHIL